MNQNETTDAFDIIDIWRKTGCGCDADGDIVTIISPNGERKRYWVNILAGECRLLEETDKEKENKNEREGKEVL